MEKNKKTIFKRIWFWIIVVVVIIIAIASSQGGNGEPKETNGSTPVQELKLGETWNVDGQWNLTINSVETTEERNQFDETNPQQVVYVTYTYENLGYEDSNGIMEGLYFSLEPGIDATIIDSNGEMADSYPNSVKTYPQETPVGAKCVNAQTCIGLNNVSDTITMNISKYDGNGKQQKVTYKLDVK